MPKSKKPAGGRPAKNFDPRYAGTSKRRPGESSAGTAGSRSPGHRGYRPVESSAKKPRWSSQRKADRGGYGKDAHGTDRYREGIYRGAHTRDDRRRPSYSEHADRGERPGYRGGYRANARDDRRGGYRDVGRGGYREDRRGGYREDRRGGYRDDRRSYSDHGRREHREYDRDDRRTDHRAHRDRRPAYRAGGPARRDGRPSYRADRPARRDFSHHSAVDADHARHNTGAHHDSGARHDTGAHHEHLDVVHERLKAQAVEADAGATASFADLSLGENIVRTLATLGAQHPFPIQAATIPAILAGKDVLGRGRTGSGKTIAFAAPLVESVLRSREGGRREFGRAPQALILAPTRELALQIDRTVQPLARCVGLFTTQVYGGVPQGRQVGALRKGVDIVIGTAGRVEDLIDQGKLDLSHVRIAVLDEADHMSELGFLEPMQRILRQVADGAQKLMFSATLDREVATLVDEFLVDPAVYEVSGEDQSSGTIDHRVLMIDRRDKPEILQALVEREGRTLVFTRTRAYAEMLCEQFDEAGIRAVALHGDLNQAKRTRNLKRVTDGKANVLVATDVAARGIHVDDITLVVQADPPDEYKTYLHRSGRTGRAGHAGTVVTLIPRGRRRRMAEMLERAEIDAPFEDARPGDDIIEEVTGRQVDPTAVAVEVREPESVVVEAERA